MITSNRFEKVNIYELVENFRKPHSSSKKSFKVGARPLFVINVSEFRGVGKGENREFTPNVFKRAYRISWASYDKIL